MNRSQKTIRGVDQDAWEMLAEVRESSRTQTGALLSSAIRFWYDHLDEDRDVFDLGQPLAVEA